MKKLFLIFLFILSLAVVSGFIFLRLNGQQPSPSFSASPTVSGAGQSDANAEVSRGYQLFEGRINSISEEELVVESGGKLVTLKMKGGKTIGTPSIPDENQIKQIKNGTRVSVSAKTEEGLLYVVSLVLVGD